MSRAKGSIAGAVGLAAWVTLLLASAQPATAINVKDDFRITLAATDADDDTDITALQLGYSHFFEPLRSEGDLPFNYEFFFSHPSAIAVNISRGDQDSPDVSGLDVDSDLTFNIVHLVGQWFIKERVGLLFSFEQIDNDLSETISDSTLEFSQVFTQSVSVPSVAVQHYYADNGAWSVQYYYTDVRADLIAVLDLLGGRAFFVERDRSDEYNGFRGDWTHIWKKRYRVSANFFSDVSSSPLLGGIFPAAASLQRTAGTTDAANVGDSSFEPSPYLENSGGGVEFEWAFARGQSAQVSYSVTEADDTDDERTTYGISYILYLGRQKTLLFQYGRTETDIEFSNESKISVDTDSLQFALRFAR